MATGRLETGNPNLKSETSNNFDITFNYDNGDFYAYASFYINDVDNYITLQDELDGHDDHDGRWEAGEAPHGRTFRGWWCGQWQPRWPRHEASGASQWERPTCAVVEPVDVEGVPTFGTLD